MNNLCLNCLNETTEKVCPYCGYAGEDYEDNTVLSRGTVLNGKYLTGKVLGRGGFGITYLAYDLNLHMKICIKEFFPNTISSRQQNTKRVVSFSEEACNTFEYGRDKFVEEGRILASFNNESSVVSVYDFFNENNTAYLVMEYLEGIDLNKHLQTMPNRRMTWQQTIEIILPVLKVLKTIHEQDVVHRDISPDNIYITTDNHVKLLDFGAARYAVGDMNKSMSVVLKYGYAPPEQYSRKGNQGPWTDVYAICATIYKCLTGKTPEDSLDRMADDELLPPSELGSDIPKNAEQALLKGMSIATGNRWQSVDKLIESFSGKEVAVGNYNAYAPMPKINNEGTSQLQLKIDKNKKYMDAVGLIEDEQFEQAKLILELLDNYKDSNKLISECNDNIILFEKKYNYAQDLISNENFEAAKKVLKEIINYKDCKNQLEIIVKYEQEISENQYLKAISLYEDNNFDKAAEIFTNINGYKQSNYYLEKIDKAVEEKKKESAYFDAVNLFKKGDFELAKQKFISLNNYKDSQNLIEECKSCIAAIEDEKIYKEALILFNNGDYIKAKELFYSIEYFKDSKEYLENTNKFIAEQNNILNYNNGKKHFEDKNYNLAAEIFDKIRDFKDSKEYLSKIYLILNEKNYGSIKEQYSNGNYDKAYQVYQESVNKLSLQTYVTELNNQVSKDLYEKILVTNRSKKNSEYDRLFELLKKIDTDREYVDKVIDNQNNQQYGKAVDLQSNKNYLRSYMIYRKLDTYKDSNEKLGEILPFVKKKLKNISIIAASVLVACALTLTVFYQIIPGVKYSSAKKELENGHYNQAISEFEMLGEFKDADDMITDATYQKGLYLMDEQKHDEALKTFTSLGTYKDSEAQVKEIKYIEAANLKEQEKYEESINAFSKISGYKDSDENISSIKYDMAESYFAVEDYESAIQLYSEIKDYNDSMDKIKECKYIPAKEFLVKSEYTNAILLLDEIGQYKDAMKLSNEAKFNYAQDLFELGKLEESLNLYLDITNDEQAKQKAIETRYLLAMSLYEQKMYLEAKEHFSLISDYEKSDYMLLETDFQLGKEAIANGKYPEAIEYLKAPETVNHRESRKLLNEAWNLIATDHLEAGEYDEAEKIFLDLKNYSQVYEARHRRAIEVYNSGDKFTAYEMFKSNTASSKSANKANEMIEEFYDMGIEAYRGDYYDKAFEYFDIIHNSKGKLINKYYYLMLAKISLENIECNYTKQIGEGVGIDTELGDGTDKSVIQQLLFFYQTEDAVDVLMSDKFIKYTLDDGKWRSGGYEFICNDGKVSFTNTNTKRSGYNGELRDRAMYFNGSKLFSLEFVTNNHITITSHSESNKKYTLQRYK